MSNSYFDYHNRLFSYLVNILDKFIEVGKDLLVLTLKGTDYAAQKVKEGVDFTSQKVHEVTENLSHKLEDFEQEKKTDPESRSINEKKF